MIGAGVFVVFAPAAAAAGSGLLLALVAAAFVAYANATSSAAARRDLSGLGRHVRVRAGTARSAVGLPRRDRVRGRQDRELRGGRARGRRVRRALRATSRRGDRGRVHHRGQLLRHHQDRRAQPRASSRSSSRS